jgi:anti-sigma B factor antagonist
MSGLIVTRSPGVALVDFAATEILDMAQAKTIGAQLVALAESKEAFDVIVDFRRVKLITSTMIGELIRFRQKCDENNVALKFCNMSKDLYGLLKKLKLHKSFDIFDSRDDAVAAIEKYQR